MTAPTSTLAAFALSASEGRTPQPLNILGAETVIKLADADTHGAAIFTRLCRHWADLHCIAIPSKASGSMY